MPIHALFGVFLGQKWGNFLYFYHTMNVTHPETRILSHNLSKSVQRFDPSSAKEMINKIK